MTRKKQHSRKKKTWNISSPHIWDKPRLGFRIHLFRNNRYSQWATACETISTLCCFFVLLLVLIYDKSLSSSYPGCKSFQRKIPAYLVEWKPVFFCPYMFENKAKNCRKENLNSSPCMLTWLRPSSPLHPWNLSLFSHNTQVPWSHIKKHLFLIIPVATSDIEVPWHRITGI